MKTLLILGMLSCTSSYAETLRDPSITCTGRSVSGKKVTVNFYEDERWGFDKGKITIKVGTFKLEYDATRTFNPSKCDDEYTNTYQADKRKSVKLIISEDPKLGMSWVTAIEEKGIKLSCKY